SYVVLDFETTGLSPRRAEVIEAGAVHVDGARPGRTYEALCRPHRPIPPGASGVHGITDDDVRDCRLFRDHVAGLIAFLGDRVLVAHHARFDTAFLRIAALRAGLPAPVNPVLCTVRLSRRLFPELPRHDLESLCRHHGIPRAARHRAAADARATAVLLDVLLERAAEQGFDDLDALRSIGDPGDGRRVERPVRLTEEEKGRLEEAILTGDRVVLRYVSRRGIRSERSVVPYAVAEQGGGARLVAYDLGAGTTRTFRLERVDGIGGAE
ncbi:WYL domain-containing protein, partial [bacterium]|nr:WYL domain-containing protein [bacterium]